VDYISAAKSMGEFSSTFT